MNLSQTPDQIYFSSDWVERRKLEAEWQGIYDGSIIREQTIDITDPDTGEKQKRYPVPVNSAKVLCKIKRDVLFGMPQSYDYPPVRVMFVPKDKGDTTASDGLQAIFDRIFADSYFGSLQAESGLMMQIRGGHAFKVAWEPGNPDLKYWTRIVSLNSSMIYPIYDRSDMWNLRECYVGYMISEDEAKTRYNVDVRGTHARGEVLYLEHWTRTEYTIYVGDKIARRVINGEFVELRGPHDFGCVPIVYVPSNRAGDFYGMSEIPDIEGMVREENDRLADNGDAVQAMSHPLLVGRDINESVKLIPIFDEKKRITQYYLHIGSTKLTANAHPPEMMYVNPPPLNEVAHQMGSELRERMMFVTRVTDAAIGHQDMSSGRVTGPVMGANIWPTVADQQTPRYDYSTMMRILIKIIRNILKAKAPVLRSVANDMPLMTNGLMDAEFIVLWNPPIPLDVQTKADILIRRLEAEGIDLVTFLRELGDLDPEGSAQKIIAEAKIFAQIEAMKKPPQPRADGTMPKQPEPKMDSTSMMNQ